MKLLYLLTVLFFSVVCNAQDIMKAKNHDAIYCVITGADENSISLLFNGNSSKISRNAIEWFSISQSKYDSTYDASKINAKIAIELATKNGYAGSILTTVGLGLSIIGGATLSVPAIIIGAGITGAGVVVNIIAWSHFTRFSEHYK